MGKARDKDSKAAKAEKKAAAQGGGGGGGGGGDNKTAMYAGGGLVALLALLFMAGSGGGAGALGSQSFSSMKPLAVGDMDTLKDVFFGGQPWLVLCGKGSAADAQSALPHFKAASSALSGRVNTGVLDCTAEMESGKSTFDRFDVNAQAGKPAALFFIGGQKPWKIPKGSITSAEGIVEYVEGNLDIEIGFPGTVMELANECLRQQAGGCALALINNVYTWQQNRPSEKALVDALAARYRRVKFSTIDTSSMDLRAGGKKFKHDADGAMTFLVIKPLAKEADATEIPLGKKKLKIGYFHYTAGSSASSLKKFFDNWKDEAQYTAVDGLPTIAMKGQKPKMPKVEYESKADERKAKRDQRVKEQRKKQGQILKDALEEGAEDRKRLGGEIGEEAETKGADSDSSSDSGADEDASDDGGAMEDGDASGGGDDNAADEDTMELD